MIKGFWEKGADCAIDVRTCDACQTSYLARQLSKIIKSAETENKKKHLSTFLDQQCHFTPFVASCEVLSGKEVSTFLKRIGKRLSDEWNQPYSIIISFV